MDGLYEHRFDGLGDLDVFDLPPSDGELPPPPPPPEGGEGGPSGRPAPRPPAPHETGLSGRAMLAVITTFVLLTASQLGTMLLGARGGPVAAFGLSLWFVALFAVPYVAGAVWLGRLRDADRAR